jgi:hypothetical protein
MPYMFSKPAGLAVDPTEVHDFDVYLTRHHLNLLSPRTEHFGFKIKVEDLNRPRNDLLELIYKDYLKGRVLYIEDTQVASPTTSRFKRDEVTAFFLSKTILKEQKEALLSGVFPGVPKDKLDLKYALDHFYRFHDLENAFREKIYVARTTKNNKDTKQLRKKLLKIKVGPDYSVAFNGLLTPLNSTSTNSLNSSSASSVGDTASAFGPSPEPPNQGLSVILNGQQWFLSRNKGFSNSVNNMISAEIEVAARPALSEMRSKTESFVQQQPDSNGTSRRPGLQIRGLSSLSISEISDDTMSLGGTDRAQLRAKMFKKMRPGALPLRNEWEFWHDK